MNCSTRRIVAGVLAVTLACGRPAADLLAALDQPEPAVTARPDWCEGPAASPLPVGADDPPLDHAGLVAPDGALVLRWVDLSLPARGWPLVLERTYRSGSVAGGAFGPGWTSSFDVRVERDPVSGAPVVVEADGNRSYYVSAGARYRAAAAPGTTLTLLPHGFQRSFADGRSEMFDRSGLLVARRDAGGPAQSIERDGAQVRAVVDTAGRRLAFEHRDGRLVAVVDPLGRTWRYRYDAHRRLEGIEDPLGRRTTFQYDGAGRLVRAVLVDGGELAVGYGEGGVEWLRGPGDATTRFRFQRVRGEELRVDRTDPAGALSRLTVRRERGGAIVESLDPAGGVITMRLTPGRIETRHAGGPPAVMELDSEGMPRRVTDAAGRRGELTVAPLTAARPTDHDPSGAPRRFVEDGHELTPTWDAAGRLVALQGPRGRETFEYDAGDRLIGYVATDGTREHYTYDAADRPQSWTAATGAVTRFSYDNRGLIARTEPAAGPPTLHEHDAAGRLTGLSEGALRWNVRYDAAGRPLSLTDQGGACERYSWDPTGRLISVTSARGVTLPLLPDAAGYPGQLPDEDGRLYRVRFDAAGDVQVNDPMGRSLVEPIEPSSPTSPTAARTPASARAIELDALGRCTRERDGSRAIQYRYGEDGELAEVQESSGLVTRWTRDPAGRLVQRVLEAPGFVRQTDWRYNALGDRVAETGSDGRVRTFRHDEHGQLIERTDRGVVERFAYDAAGRVIRATRGPLELELEYGATGELARAAGARPWTLRSGPESGRRTLVDGRSDSWTERREARAAEFTDPAGRTIRHEYDTARRLVAVAYPEGRLSYERDAQGRVVACRLPGGQRTTYAYGADGQLSEITRPSGARIRMERDPSGRVTQLAVGAAPPTRWQVDAEGRVTGVSDTLGVHAFTYTPAGQLARARDAFGHELVTRYDALGRRIELEGPAGVKTSFGYDTTGRLGHVSGRAGITRLSYGPDGEVAALELPGGQTAAVSRGRDGRVQHVELVASGTRVERTYRRDGQGNVLAISGSGSDRTFRYGPGSRLIDPAPRTAGPKRLDADGNVAELDSGLVLEHDALGRVVSASRPGQPHTRYRYDFRGRLVERVRPGETVRFLYDGAALVAALDAQGRPLAWIERAGPTLRVNGSGTSTVVLQDPTGTPIARVAGDAVTPVEISPWGESSDRELASALAGFAGAPCDPAMGLVFLGARAYLPELGRFSAPDPALVPLPVSDRPWTAEPLSSAWPLDLAGYALGNPLRFEDSTGLWPLEAIASIGPEPGGFFSWMRRPPPPGAEPHDPRWVKGGHAGPEAGPWEGADLLHSNKPPSEPGAGTECGIKLETAVPGKLYRYVIDSKGRLWIAPENGVGKHSALVPPGEQVVSAGELYIDPQTGKVSVNTKSGHYMLESMGEDLQLYPDKRLEWEQRIRKTLHAEGREPGKLSVDPNEHLAPPSKPGLSDMHAERARIQAELKARLTRPAPTRPAPPPRPGIRGTVRGLAAGLRNTSFNRIGRALERVLSRFPRTARALGWIGIALTIIDLGMKFRQAWNGQISWGAFFFDAALSGILLALPFIFGPTGAAIALVIGALWALYDLLFNGDPTYLSTPARAPPDLVAPADGPAARAPPPDAPAPLTAGPVARTALRWVTRLVQRQRPVTLGDRMRWLAGEAPAGSRLAGNWRWLDDQDPTGARPHAGEPEDRHLIAPSPADPPWFLGDEDCLVQYVKVDAAQPARQLLLQLYASGGDGEHRVFFGEPRLDTGVSPGPALRGIGPVPPAGRWYRLLIRGEQLGLVGRRIEGLVFGSAGGRVRWGATAVASARDPAPPVAAADAAQVAAEPVTDWELDIEPVRSGLLSVERVRANGARDALGELDGVGRRRLLFSGGPEDAGARIAIRSPGAPTQELALPTVLPLVARIHYPPADSVGRETIPVFGQAGGVDFREFVVDYRSAAATGNEPWHELSRSTLPTTIEAAQIDATLRRASSGSLRRTVYGNLASLHTGSVNHRFEFQPVRAAIAPDRLVVRLRVFARSGAMAEDRREITIGEVAENLRGASVTSADGKARLRLPPLSLPCPGAALAVERVEPPPGLALTSHAYRLAPAGLALAHPGRISLDGPGVLVRHRPSSGWRPVSTDGTGAVDRLEPDETWALAPSPQRTEPASPPPAPAPAPAPALPRPAGAAAPHLQTTYQVAAPDELVEASGPFPARRFRAPPGPRSAAELLVAGPFDPAVHRQLAFSYRVTPGSTVHLLVRQGERTHVIPFAGQAPADAFPALPAPRAVDDGAWHHAVISLGTAVRGAPIDEIRVGTLHSTGWREVLFDGLRPGSELAVAHLWVGPEWPLAGPSTVEVAVAAGTWSYALDRSPASPAADVLRPFASPLVLNGLASGLNWLHLVPAGGGPAVTWPVLADRTPPVVAELSPAPGASAPDMRIAVKLTDAESGVDPASLRLAVAGHPVPPSAVRFDAATGRVSVAFGDLSQAPALEPGKSVEAAVLEARDRAGNSLAKPVRWSWTFSAPVVAAGRPRLLTTAGGQDAAWAPDGKALVFVAAHEGSPDLYRVDLSPEGLPAGTGRLTRDAALESSPAFSADGRLAFARRAHETDAAEVCELAGAELRRLGVTGEDPVWLDKERIAYVSGNQVVAHPIAGGPSLILAALGPGATARRPRPVSGGAGIVLGQSLYHESLWSAEPDRVPVALSDRLDDSALCERDPAPSPDGRWIAYAGGGDGPGLWLLDRKSGERTRLVAEPALGLRRPAWSPDGRWLVYDSDSTGLRNLWLLEAAWLPRLDLEPALAGGAGGPVRVRLGLDRPLEITATVHGADGRAVAALATRRRAGPGKLDLVWSCPPLPAGQLARHEVRITLAGGLVARATCLQDAEPPRTRLHRSADGRELSAGVPLPVGDRLVLSAEDGAGCGVARVRYRPTPDAAWIDYVAPLDPAAVPDLEVSALDRLGNAEAPRRAFPPPAPPPAPPSAPSPAPLPASPPASASWWLATAAAVLVLAAALRRKRTS